MVGPRPGNARLEHPVEVFRGLASGARSEKPRLDEAGEIDIETELQAHLFRSELFEEALRTAALTGGLGSLPLKAHEPIAG